MTDEIQGPQRWINSQNDSKLSEIKKSQDEFQRETRSTIESIWREIRTDQRQADARGSTIGIIEDRLKDFRSRLETVEKTIHEDTLSKDDFRPYRNGLVSLVVAVGMAVLSGILKLVIGPK